MQREDETWSAGFILSCTLQRLVCCAALLDCTNDHPGGVPGIHRIGLPKRGRIVVLTQPAGWLRIHLSGETSANKGGARYLKRCTGPRPCLCFHSGCLCGMRCLIRHRMPLWRSSRMLTVYLFGAGLAGGVDGDESGASEVDPVRRGTGTDAHLFRGAHEGDLRRRGSLGLVTGGLVVREEILGGG